jgi:hypothetical protein
MVEAAMKPLTGEDLIREAESRGAKSTQYNKEYAWVEGARDKRAIVPTGEVKPLVAVKIKRVLIYILLALSVGGLGWFGIATKLIH